MFEQVLNPENRFYTLFNECSEAVYFAFTGVPVVYYFSGAVWTSKSVIPVNLSYISIAAK